MEQDLLLANRRPQRDLARNCQKEQTPLNVKLTYPNGDSGNPTFLKPVPEGETSYQQTDCHAWECEQQEIAATKGVNLLSLF